MGLLRTRKFKYAEYTEAGDEIVEITEQEILEKNWVQFHDAIYNIDNANTRRLRKLPLSLQGDECINEFLIVNWAWEITDDKF